MHCIIDSNGPSIILRSIEQVHSSGEISIDGTVFQVVLFLGGDMKFLQLSMGLSDRGNIMVHRFRKQNFSA